MAVTEFDGQLDDDEPGRIAHRWRTSAGCIVRRTLCRGPGPGKLFIVTMQVAGRSQWSDWNRVGVWNR